MNKKRLFLIVGMSFILSGCAEQVQGPNPISVLQQQYMAQQQQIEEINRRLDSLDQSLANLRVKLGFSTYDNITNHLKSESEPQSPNIASSLPEVRPSKGIKNLSNSVTMINSTPSSSNNLQALIGNSAPQQQSPQSTYNDAYRAYQSGHYEEAKNLFKQYILNNPNNDLTGNAYYWLGMSYKALNKNNEALAILLSLIQKCKEAKLISCSKAPSAYFSAANIYKEMGQKQQAVRLYNELIKAYPNSIEAALAKSELEIQ